MNQKKRLSVKTVVLIGMFGALAAVLETFQIPVPFAPPFYKLDFAETPIMIGAFALGPVPAILMELVKNLLKILINGTTTMYVGDLGNFIGGCSLCASGVHPVPEAPHQEDGHGRTGTFRSYWRSYGHCGELLLNASAVRQPDVRRDRKYHLHGNGH